MPHQQSLTETEASVLSAEISRFGETAVARASGIHRQTLNRAANRRRLYKRTRSQIRAYIDRVAAAQAAEVRK